MTLENEKRLLLLMSSYVIANDVTKAKVLDLIEANGWVNLSEDDKKIKHNRNELVWRNDFAFVRKHLEQNGFYISGERNNWAITEIGIKLLYKLCAEAAAESNLLVITPKGQEAAFLLLKKMNCQTKCNRN